jgi:hypothetical protein
MSKPQLSAKDYLSKAYRIDRRINSKIEQVQSLHALSTKATTTLSDIPPSKGIRNVHRMEDIIAKMVDLESEINADLNRLIDLKHEIITVVKCVENPELQTLLELRYLCFKTWEEIAVEINWSIRQVYYMHGEALREVEPIRRC